VLVNEALDYLRVGMFSVGGGWRLRDRLVVSVEGFYKKYGNIPLSVSDGIPLSCKGDDYGVVGNEALRPTAVGRSYGIEAMARWQIPGRVNLVGSVTLFRSEYRADAASEYIVSAWDSPFRGEPQRYVRPAAQLERRARLSAVGGRPIPPYDVRKIVVGRSLGRRRAPYV